MNFNPYLNFNGQCEAAFKFYEECLGARVVSMFKYAESPMASQVPADWQNKVMHATLMLGEAALMGADPPPSPQYEPPKGFSISLNTGNVAEAERVFKALSEQAKILVPLQQTFWAMRFGMLVDRFGIPWMVNCEEAPK